MKKMYRTFSYCLLFFFLYASAVWADDKGSIIGLITDKSFNEPLTGATIQITGGAAEKGIGTVTDLDGHFTLTGLKSGTYTLSIQYISYKPITLNEVKVEKGKQTLVQVEMAEENLALEGVVVIAQAKQNTDLAMLKATKASLLVQSGISQQQITRTQDRDASEVIRRIPGISIIDNKFVMVRGLSQRYNNVWINNSAVPSSEADARAFSFDIIPSSQMDNMIVVKSPAPELPADFSGGFIKINTKDVPEKNAFNITLGGSVNDQTHFSPFHYNTGSKTDWLGFDGGMRKLEGAYTSRLDNNDAAAVSRITQNGFNNDWTIRTRTPLADLRLNAAFNHKTDLGGERQFAILSALNYTNASKTAQDMENARFSIYDVKGDKPDYTNRYTDNVYSRDVRLGGMLNLTYRADSRNKYELKNIVNQLGQNRYTTRSGYQYISGMYIQEKQEYYYASRTTYNGQFTATHTRDKSRLDWNVGYAYASKSQPDRRIVNREENGYADDAHFGEIQIDQNEMQREFSRLNEHIASASLNYQLDFQLAALRPTLKAGVYGEYRNRDYNTRSFYYRWNGNNLPDGFEYGNVTEDILIPENYASDRLYIYEDTDNRNSYKGQNSLMAAYVGLNIPIEKLNIYAGVRYENNTMKLTSYTAIKEFRTRTNRYPTNNLFPSLNTSYKLNEQHQLRLSYGASVNRPEFREISSSVFYDFDLFSDVKGNPDLQTAYIQNADLRYEYYPSPGEILSVALFYKHFKNPIEWTYLDAGGSYTYTFENAAQANNYGIELEIRKNLAFIGLKDFSWNFNGALIKSKVNFAATSLEADRQMQGQSPYLINTGLFYQHDRTGLNAGVLYNRIGRRIVGVGRVDTSDGAIVNNDIPDSYEMPRNTIDLNLSKKFGTRWELKASLRDLLAERVIFKQFPRFYDTDHVLQEREQITKQYKPGRNFYLSVSYNL